MILSGRHPVLGDRTDLRSFLEAAGLEQYFDAFCAKRLDVQSLVQMDEKDMHLLQIDLQEDFSKLLKAIRAVKKHQNCGTDGSGNFFGHSSEALDSDDDILLERKNVSPVPSTNVPCDRSHANVLATHQ